MIDRLLDYAPVVAVLIAWVWVCYEIGDACVCGQPVNDCKCEGEDMAGKGSGRRPGEGYEDNHEAIFGKRERKQWTPPPLPQPKQKDEKED